MRAREAMVWLFRLSVLVVLIGAVFVAVPTLLLTKAVTDGVRYTAAGMLPDSKALAFTVAKDYPHGAILECGVLDFVRMREPGVKLKKYLVAAEISDDLSRVRGVVHRSDEVQCEGGVHLDFPVVAGLRVMVRPRLRRATKGKLGIWQFYATLAEPPSS